MRFPLALLLTVFVASSPKAAPLDEWCAHKCGRHQASPCAVILNSVHWP